MQEFKGDELLKTVQGDMKELTALKMETEATHRTIGRFPVRGSIVTLNGLQFVVKSMSVKHGTITLEIRKPIKKRK